LGGKIGYVGGEAVIALSGIELGEKRPGCDHRFQKMQQDKTRGGTKKKL